MRIVSEGLTFTYNKKTKFAKKALDGVSLVIEEGEFFGIIGHTGSGKSTFIQHLNALIPVEEGTLKIGDRDLSASVKKSKKKKFYRELRSKVGMVFQYPEYQLFAETVYDDVAFGYKNFFPEAKKEDIDAAVYGALEMVGLSREQAGKSPFELSGGQKRRAAIAGVIVTRPEILVLDEPVAGLDPKGKRELMALLHYLHGTACKTVVIVSHDMDEVADNCTRIAVFSEGKAVMQGSPAEIFSKTEELVNLRLDVPVTAYLSERLEEVGTKIETDYSVADFTEKTIKAYGGKSL